MGCAPALYSRLNIPASILGFEEGKESTLMTSIVSFSTVSGTNDIVIMPDPLRSARMEANWRIVRNGPNRNTVQLFGESEGLYVELRYLWTSSKRQDGCFRTRNFHITTLHSETYVSSNSKQYARRRVAIVIMCHESLSSLEIGPWSTSTHCNPRMDFNQRAASANKHTKYV